MSATTALASVWVTFRSVSTMFVVDAISVSRRCSIKTDRTRHDWFWNQKDRCWKCALCGGTISKPSLPSPNADAERYEALTEEERARSPKE